MPRFGATSNRSPRTTPCCTGRWGGSRSSSPRNGAWPRRRRRASPTPSLLIYHSYSGRGRKRELPARGAAIHLELVEQYRPLLPPRFRDLDAPYQSVLAVDPDHRCAVRLIALLGRERDQVRRPAAERVHPDIARVVALVRMLHELADQVRPGRAHVGDARPDHLARRGARRVEPQVAAVRHDAVALGLGEAHRE